MDYREDSSEPSVVLPALAPRDFSERTHLSFGLILLDPKKRVPTLWDSNQYSDQLSSGQSLPSEADEPLAFEPDLSGIDSDSRELFRLEKPEREGEYGLEKFSWTDSDIFQKNGELSPVYHTVLRNAVEAETARRTEASKNITFAQATAQPRRSADQNFPRNFQSPKGETEVHLVLDESSEERRRGGEAAQSLQRSRGRWGMTQMRNYFLAEKKPRDRSISPQPNFFFKPTQSHRQYLAIIKEKFAAAKPEAPDQRESKTSRPSRSVLTRTHTSSSEHLSSSLTRSNKKRRLNNPLVTEFQKTIKPKHILKVMSKVKEKLMIRERRDPVLSSAGHEQGRVPLKSQVSQVRDRSYDAKLSQETVGPVSFSVYLSHKTVDANPLLA